MSASIDVDNNYVDRLKIISSVSNQVIAIVYIMNFKEKHEILNPKLYQSSNNLVPRQVDDNSFQAI